MPLYRDLCFSFPSEHRDHPRYKKQEITYYLIGGIPFIVYLGVLTFILFFITGMIAMLRRKGKTKIPVQWHFRLAYLSLALGSLHLILGVFSYI